MKQLCLNYFKIPMLVIFPIFAVMIYNSAGNADEYNVNTNLTSISEMMSKWSKQLSTGKVDPKAQEKMGEIMSHMSQVLQEMAGGGVGEMNMQHHAAIEDMKKEWNPFDTSGSD